jgi:hypothetical protein
MCATVLAEAYNILSLKSSAVAHCELPRRVEAYQGMSWHFSDSADGLGDSTPDDQGEHFEGREEGVHGELQT